MAELPSDVVEDILVRLDVKDLIRCKSVCKSWQSFISSSRFVQAHLNHAYKRDRDNHEFGHRRICVSFSYKKELSSFYGNETRIVGSCNGLVCVSPRDVEFVITNPSTREEKKLPTPPFMHKRLRIRDKVECWGFGYDSSADEYKVIVGFKNNYETVFHVFTLKSNTWKVIEQVKYKIYVDVFYSYVNTSGILCGGALHWIITHQNMKVIISLDLSTEEFKEIPVPLDLLYDCSHCYRLGIIEECLCIYTYCSPSTSKKLVMKNNEWKPYNINKCKSNYDIAHLLTNEVGLEITTYIHDDGRHMPNDENVIFNGLFVKSLVSPHLHVIKNGQKRNIQVPSKCL
ncbi:F-box/kelch-repeat protein At3g06240-like [Bidens hawaiensis]|uniref:F-box/kelch-repeat protein At3g06240-like n=1 Tax=Bidens hawaiensis TaxID=980011 RepID=UPI0040490002